MNIVRTRMLIVTPLILTAMAVSVSAQEAGNAISSSTTNATLASASGVTSEAGLLLLELIVPTSGTYAFSAPANSGLALRLGGQAVFDAGTATDGVAKSLMSLTAGPHLVEVSGDNVTMNQINLISVNLIGMPSTSLASMSKALTGDSAVMSDDSGASLRTSAATIADSILTLGTSTGSGTSTSGGTASTGLVGTILNGATPTAPSDGGIDTLIGSILDAITSAVAGHTSQAPNPGPTLIVPQLGDGEAQTSPTSPPVGVVLTSAVEITGGATDQNVVASTGQTLFGAVMDQMTYDTVNVTIMPSNRTTTVDIGDTTGQFVVRLFPEDMTSGEVTVTVTAVSSVDETVATDPLSYDFTAATPDAGLAQALMRMTNGPTADLYAHVRAIGYENFVNEQLNPDWIDDSAYEAMHFDRLNTQKQERQLFVVSRLISSNIGHSAFSQKQFQDVMGDFWSNHFHTAIPYNGALGTLAWQGFKDRAFYRENAFGNFEDLLLYSARSPLMSAFLNNDKNRRANAGEERTTGINENYGREILELHTVGANAGYSQEDVIASSLVFTGWNRRIINLNSGNAAPIYEFDFRLDDHDTEDKFFPFLNTTITGRSGPDGVLEGEELIAILANHPQTRQFVCGKIVQRLVADEMPAGFVDICVNAWAASSGNMREVFRAILTAPDYVTDVSVQQSKFKTPYEYVVSIVRALDLTPEYDKIPNPGHFSWTKAALLAAGYNPEEFFVPTGMPEVADRWMTTAVMIALYMEATEFTNNLLDSNPGFIQRIEDEGLETAEAVAAYILTIATADRFTREEFEQMVDALNGADGLSGEDKSFDRLVNRGRGFKREKDLAFRRAAGLLVVLPSFIAQ